MTAREQTQELAADLLIDAVGNPIDFGAELRVFLGDPMVEGAAPEGWTYLRSAREAVLAAILGEVAELSLTNDLSEPRIFGSGSEVIRFFESEMSPAAYPRDGVSFRDNGGFGAIKAGNPPGDMTGQRIEWDGELRVFLDDDVEGRTAGEGWIQLRSVREVAMTLLLGKVVELSLDSDLNGDAVFGQGFQIIDFLESQEAIAGASLWPRDGITIHTANPGSRQKMRQAIETVPRRHPHLTVREAKDRPASQPHFTIERVEEGEG